jgi:hypothetical protein
MPSCDGMGGQRALTSSSAHNQRVLPCRAHVFEARPTDLWLALAYPALTSDPCIDAAHF